MSPAVRRALGVALRPAWAVALVVLGAMTLATAWHRWPISLLFAVVAALPLLALRGAIRAGMSRWFASTMLLLIAVMAGYLATARADLSLSRTLRDVIPLLLTSPQPYAVRADLLAGPLLLTAFVSVFVGLRLDSRIRVEPVLGGALLYVAGALLTAGRADPWGLVAVLMVVVALVGWALLDEHAEPAWQRISIAAPLTVVCAGALAAVATLPVANGFEPRTLVDRPTTEITASNPLAQLGAWANNPDAELLRVRGDEVPLRLVVLDEYDGTQWSSSTTYAMLGSEGDTGFEAGRFRSDASVEVQFERLGGQWLPSPGTPLAVGEPSALVDPETGTLYFPGDTDEVVYEVAGSYDDPPTEELATARVPDDGMTPFLEVPEVGNDLAAYAARVTQNAITPYEQALAIERRISGNYELVPTTISGSALWRIRDFLIGDPGAPGGRVGTAEQFATAFALVARLNGLPTRVVVGFRPGELQDDGTRLIRGRDAFAWAEIYFEELGWVPFSPTPGDDSFSRPAPVEATTPELPAPAPTGSVSVAPTTPPPTTGTITPTQAAPDPAAAPAADGGLPPAPVLAGAGVLVLLLALAALRLGRSLRHRRRGAPGAWAEVVDALRLTGQPPRPSQPADVVAEAADARWSTSSAVLVAQRAELSAFGPADAAAVPASAEVRDHVRAVRRRARRSLPWWRRWWFWLDPRVLFRR